MSRLNLAWATARNLDESEYVLFGVPDESGSHSYRKGSSLGPDRIRKVSQERDMFVREKKLFFEQPEHGMVKDNLFDFGNIKRRQIDVMVKHVAAKNKKLIVVGGDHSITFDVLKSLNDVYKEISVIYLDAHPDFVCSSHRYYGSVMCDVLSLKNVKLSSSVELGVRAPEKEELLNVKKSHIRTITPFDIAEKGIKVIAEEIIKHVGKNVYISIDVDVLDPAFAHGVSTPVPGGLNSNDFFYLLKRLSALNVIGFDIMEVCPKYDVNDMTSHLAARAIAELISK